MTKPDFVHLHLHTEYSLLDGACRIDRLFERAKELGQSAVAITDHGVMYGALAFYQAAKQAGIKPVIGCEVYVAPRKCTDKEHLLDREYSHLVLLCENKTGYQNLISLVTHAFTEGFYQKPRIDMELLEEHHEGLIAFSACLAGRIPQLILEGKPEEAEAAALEMKRIFGKENFFLELQDHGIPEQMRVNAVLCRIAEKCELALVCTNDVHYLRREDAKIHDVLLCIQTGKTLSDEDRMRFQTEEFYLKSAEEMQKLFLNRPDALLNTVKIAERCNLEFDLDHPHLPHFINPDGVSSEVYLRKAALEGMEKRFLENGITNRKPYLERLDFELSVIEKMGFCDYFLIVADFVGFAKKSEIYVGPGRGSGAGSLAAWCLDISEIDPIENDLIFERFLNPERISMPDFDVDFCYERRHEVIEYVASKYGEDHVAQIVTFSTMAARAVVRDVGRVMGISYADTDKIAKRIPHFLNITLNDALKADKDLREMCSEGEKKELLEIARALEGMPRNASVHAAGVVLTDRPIEEYVPLAVNSGLKVTQFTMNEIADLGLLKIDFLGLRYLTIIRDAVNLIRQKEPDFDIHRIPLDDKAVYRMISEGNTSGMFQIESSGMRSLMMQIAPTCLDDVMAAIALYRPGPKDSIPRFLESKRSGKIEYLVPELEEILKMTYGCIIYQEQVMQIFQKLAGYSYGRADVVRRAMSKKKVDVMEKERTVFLHGATLFDGKMECEGCLRRGIPLDKANKIFDEMADFAKYAFNKSHAAAYSLLSYRTAFLKCKYPKEYMAAILTSQLDSDKYAFYMSECRKMGIRILPPDVNESDFSFSVCPQGIRFGLVGVKNVGKGLIDAIFEEKKRGRFTDFGDFIERTKPCGLNRKALESLVLAGAFDSFGIARARLFSAIDTFLATAGEAMRRVMPGQMSLFDANPAAAPSSLRREYPDIPEFEKTELLRQERRVCGVYLSGHPLEEFRTVSEKIGAKGILELSEEETKDGEKITLLVYLRTVTQKKAKTGEKMAFLQVEDLGSSLEVICFPKTAEKYAPLIEAGNILVIHGTINTRDEDIKIIASSLLTPEEALREEEKNKAQIANKTEQNHGENVKIDKIEKIYLRFEKKGVKMENQVMGLLGIFPGEIPVYFYYRDTQKLFRKQGTGLSLNKTALSELKEMLGDDVVFK